MDQHQIDIPTGNDGNSAEIEEPAGAAVGEADSGSQPPNLNYTNYAQEDDISYFERRVRTLANVKGLEPTKNNLWKVPLEECLESQTRSQNAINETEEKMRSLKNEVYQVIGFFNAFQGLLITAAAQSNLLRCNNVGFILVLSAFATAVAVFGISQKIKTMEKLGSTYSRARLSKKEVNRWLRYLQVSGISFDFRFFDQKLDIPNFSRKSCKEILVDVGTWLVVSIMAFGGLCIVAMRQIVCNPGHSLPSY